MTSSPAALVARSSCCHLWHFRFNGSTPEALVKGRERTCFDYYWNELAADRSHSIPEADRAAYTAAYARPEMEENPQKTMARWQTSSDRPEDLSPGCPAEGAGV